MISQKISSIFHKFRLQFPLFVTFAHNQTKTSQIVVSTTIKQNFTVFLLKFSAGLWFQGPNIKSSAASSLKVRGAFAVLDVWPPRSSLCSRPKSGEKKKAKKEENFSLEMPKFWLVVVSRNFLLFTVWQIFIH